MTVVATMATVATASAGVKPKVRMEAQVVGLDQGAEVEAVGVGLDQEVLALAVVVVVGAMDRMAEPAERQEGYLPCSWGYPPSRELPLASRLADRRLYHLPCLASQWRPS